MTKMRLLHSTKEGKLSEKESEKCGEINQKGKRKKSLKQGETKKDENLCQNNPTRK